MPTWCFNVLFQVWNCVQNCRDWDFCECLDLETVLLSSPDCQSVEIGGLQYWIKSTVSQKGIKPVNGKAESSDMGKDCRTLHRWTLGTVYRRAFKSNRHWLNWVRTQQTDCHLLKWKSEVQMNCINVTTLKPNKQTKEWKASQKYSLGISQELSNVDK